MEADHPQPQQPSQPPCADALAPGDDTHDFVYELDDFVGTVSVGPPLDGVGGFVTSVRTVAPCVEGVWTADGGMFASLISTRIRDDLPKDELVLVPENRLARVGDIADGAKVLVGLFGSKELLFRLDRENGCWKVRPGEYFPELGLNWGTVQVATGRDNGPS
jgi:hypothetical protein